MCYPTAMLERSPAITPPIADFTTVFFIALSLLTTVTLSIRAAQVAFGDNFLFFIIPLTFLGIGVGGACAYAGKTLAQKRFFISCSLAFFAFTALIFLVPAHAREVSGDFAAMMLFFAAGFASNVCGSWIIAVILQNSKAHTPLLYALDLSGGALGAIFAALLLNAKGYESAAVLAVTAAALPFLVHVTRKQKMVVGVGILAVVLLYFILPLSVTNKLFHITCSGRPETNYTATNSFSQIDVETISLHSTQEMGLDTSGETPQETAYFLNVDCGSFGTALVPMSPDQDLSFLRYSLRSIAFELTQERFGKNVTSLIPSSGAGIDIARARLFGDGHIDAVEFNPNVITVARLFTATSTFPYGLSNVSLHETDARRFIETSTSTYQLVLLGRAGLYGSLATDSNSPSYSNTVEAIATFVQHLAPHGVLAYARSPAPGLVEFIATGLEKAGVDPSNKIAFVQGRDGKEDLVLAQREDFSDAEKAYIAALASERGFSSVFPERPSTLNDPYAGSDDRPYSKTLKINSYDDHILRTVLLITALAGIVTLVVGVYLALESVREQGGHTRWAMLSFSLYIACIGFGFTFFQLGAIQKLLLLVAEPSWALAIALASFLCATGLGSLATFHLREDRFAKAAVAAMSFLFVYLLLGAYFGNDVLRSLLPYEFTMRAILAGLLIAPPAFALGIFLPIGLRAAAIMSGRLVPWVWALDGLFSVAGGVAAKILFYLVGLHLMFPVTMVTYGAAVCAFLAFAAIQRRLFRDNAFPINT